MEPDGRRTVRYDDFARRPSRRRRWPWVVGVTALLAVAGGAAAWMLQPQGVQAPPIALASAGGPVANERYQWKHVAIGGGGMISGLSMDPAGKTFIVRTDVYGAYIWSPRADRWDQLATAASMPDINRTQNGIAQGAYEVVVAPSRPSRLYMAVKGRVYRSDDGGARWTLPGAGNPFPFAWEANGEYRLHGPFMAVDPGNPDLVLLGTPEAGLWRSADAGSSWSRVATVPTSVDRAPDTAGVQAPGTMVWFERPAGGRATGRIFAHASGHGMYGSADGGRSFAPLGAGGPHPLTLQRGAFDRRGTFFGVDDRSQSVWAYADGRWRDVTAEAGLAPHEYAAVAANPRADQVVIVDRGGQGYESTDGGKTWSSVAHTAKAGDGDPPWLRVADAPYFTTGDMMFDPVIPNRLWVAHGQGVFYADMPPGSGTMNWISRTRGIEELVANDVVQPPGQPPIFANWDFGVHVKSDLNAFSTTFGPNERMLMSVQQLDWSPADPRTIVTNASDQRNCCAQDGNAVMAGYSRDGGQTWRKFPTLPTPPGTQADDPWRMAFGTIAVSSSDTDNVVWAPAHNRQPYYTLDGGSSWKPVLLPGATGDAPGAFRFPWFQRKTMTADKTQGAVFYYYHSGEAPNPGLLGLWRSGDGGLSWVRTFAGEIAPNSDNTAKLRSVPGHGGHLFFTSAFEHTTDTGLRRSIDGGTTWSMVPGVNRVDDVAFGKAARGAGYPAIYISGKVGGDYGIWRSIDDAATWQRLVDFPVGSLDQVTAIGADPDVFGRVYVGYLGSSWIWGEPAPCEPGPYRAFAATQCSQVR